MRQKLSPNWNASTAPALFPSIRLRRTPYSRRNEEFGVKAYTVYNHMLIPRVFRSLKEDYDHLKSAVQVWDVSVQRQIEIVGLDAYRLLQFTTPRDLSQMADDQCFYIPVVNSNAKMLNDPVLIKRGDDRYWMSIADTDMLLYYQGLATGFQLNVNIFEADVYPLAVQGPLANELVRRVFGPEVVNLKFFRYKTVHFQGKEMVVTRSGASHQGGFEFYVEGKDACIPLWDALFEAGRDLDVFVGCPNDIERIEAGFLSYGSDITIENTPFEVGLGKFCQLETAVDCLAHSALIAHQHPQRQIRFFEIEGKPLPPADYLWPIESINGARAGFVSSASWSPDFDFNVGIGMVDRTFFNDKDAKFIVNTPLGKAAAVMREKAWI